jgi:hypothetical protein
MSMAAQQGKIADRAAVWTASPLLALAVALAGVVVLLLTPIRVPIGPMYWDVFIYYDAANRIFDGQVPVNDFFTPVGPLGYYLFAGWVALFPDGAPTLLAHWSLLAVTAPLMALVVWHVDGRSRTIAYALLIPFLIFALLPFNSREFYPFPGSDGFGIYNRQVCQMLYVLVAALMFVRSPRLLALVVAVSMTALFFLKITGFVSGAIICLYAFMAGRIPLRHALAAAAGFLAVLALLEVTSGLVSHYIRDILALVEINSGSLAPRFLQAMSHTFGVLLPGGALILLLLWSGREKLATRLSAIRTERSAGAVAKFLDNDAFWLAAVLFAGITFETQNTGSQAMIFVWPVVLSIVMRSGALMAKPRLLIATFVLAAAMALPPAINTIERAARAYAGSVKNFPLEHANLKSLGAISMRGDVLERSQKMIDFYPAHRDVFEKIVAMGELPSFILYSDFDFQITHLKAIDRAIDSIRALEAKNGVRFETIMALNFVNPFPWLMDRSAPRHVAIGADPMRAVPPPGPLVADSIRDTDIILLPKCPPTTANAALLELYAPMMTGHRRIALDACYDAYVHPKFAGKLD